jgi:DNA-binding LytR/AlgR family response regulator
MKVIIIEDEAPAFRRLQKIIEDVAQDIQIEEVIDSVEDSIKYLNNHQLPDLIFMDIQLSDGISFDIFDQVEVSCPVIFTTAFDDYMLKAFKVNSIDYLLKPIKLDDLKAALSKLNHFKSQFQAASADYSEILRQIRHDQKQYKQRFLIKQGDKMMSINTDQVAFFHLRNGVVMLHTWENKSYLLDFNLDEIIQQLDPSLFFRANRQIIVHLDAVKVAHRYHKGKVLLEIQPTPSEQVIVSAERASEFKQWFGDQ